jgi:DNA ligase-4
MIDRYSISKKNILYLNCYSYFEQVLFANSIPEFDIGLDYRQQLQPAELFKYLFSAELIGTGFDKPANTRYFALRFPRLLKIYRDRLFNNTISFEELQEIAKQCNKVLKDSKREETSWLRKLGRYNFNTERSRSSLPSYDSSASVTEATRVDSKIVVQQQKSTNKRTRKREVASKTFREVIQQTL